MAWEKRVIQKLSNLFGPTFVLNLQANPENEVSKACFKMMSDNSDLVKNPWAMLAMIFPGLRRLLTFIKPTLGLNVDGATVALKQFQAVQQVRFFSVLFRISC